MSQCGPANFVEQIDRETRSCSHPSVTFGSPEIAVRLRLAGCEVRIAETIGRTD